MKIKSFPKYISGLRYDKSIKTNRKNNTKNIVENAGDRVYIIKDIPVKDTPLILVTGNFI